VNIDADDYSPEENNGIEFGTVFHISLSWIFISLFDFKFSVARIIWSIVMLKDGGTESDVLCIWTGNGAHPCYSTRWNSPYWCCGRLLLLSPTFVSVNDQVKITVVGGKHRELGQLCGQIQDLS
jgi:hypothetical protein